MKLKLMLVAVAVVAAVCSTASARVVVPTGDRDCRWASQGSSQSTSQSSGGGHGLGWYIPTFTRSQGGILMCYWLPDPT